MGNLRMAAYCRVSTEKEEQLSSLENQREFFEQYAEKNGDTLVNIYADEGISGKSMKKRGAFTRLLSDSEKGDFDYVAVKDISRFARNTSDFLYGIRTLRANGVDVRFLSGNQTVIGESEFVLTVFAALAQEESANLSKRVIFGKKQNAKKGRVPNVIYGYDKTDTYTLRINERESEIVKLMFKWYIEGLGTRRICARLNDMGIPTKRGAKWISQTVKRILANPVYAGRLINNKSVTKDFLAGTRVDIPENEWYVHERPELRIISGEDFKLVSDRLAERREQYKSPDVRYSSKHLFSNLIRCGECGKPFNARVFYRKNTYVKYRCGAHNRCGVQCCKNSASVEENELINEVVKRLEEQGRSLGKKNAVMQAQDDMSCIVRAREQLDHRRERLKEIYLNGLIGMDELKKEFERIENSLENVEREFADMSEVLDGAAPEYTNNDLREVVDKIVVYPDKSVEVFLK